MEKHKTLDDVIYWAYFFGFCSLPFLGIWFAVWFYSPNSNAFRSAVGFDQLTTVKTAKPKTIPCKILDDETGTKECKVTLDDGRIVTCIVDGDDKSCDWAHAKPKDTKHDSQHRMK